MGGIGDERSVGAVRQQVELPQDRLADEDFILLDQGLLHRIPILLDNSGALMLIC